MNSDEKRPKWKPLALDITAVTILHKAALKLAELDLRLKLERARKQLTPQTPSPEKDLP